MPTTKPFTTNGFFTTVLVNAIISGDLPSHTPTYKAFKDALDLAKYKNIMTDSEKQVYEAMLKVDQRQTQLSEEIPY